MTGLARLIASPLLMSDRIGNYRVLNEVGAGGMAVVYKAIQEPLGRLVAIKALKSSIAMDSQFAMRFEREAHFMASLQHENILHVVDFVKDGNSMYIVMEYVQGIDLYDLLELSPVLPAEEAAIIALQVARALDYAHFRGIIHRDIKPANIMLSKQGEVKLMDFGIARDDKLSDLTETGTGLGTPSYMSPEQILGDKLDFLAFWHDAHFSVVEVAPLVPQRTEPGRAPARPVIDTSRPHEYVYMVRDLGNKRVPAGVITVLSLIIFLILCWLLHRRDRVVAENRAALPAKA